MKKLLIVLFVLILFPCHIFPQWTNELSLFSINSGTKVESCVSTFGTHVVYSYGGALNYAYVNASGTVATTSQIESSNADFPNILSSGSNLYAVYKKNNQINIKVSTNLGTNWGTAYAYNLKNTGCNDLKAMLSQNSIHIVWSELRSGYEYTYDAHYVEFNYSNPTWQGYKRVTDLEPDGGDMPRIAFTTSKLYVIYKSQPLLLYGREKNLSTGTWGDVELIPVLPIAEGGEGELYTAFIRYHNIYAANDRFSVIYRMDIYHLYSEESGIAQCYKLYNNGTWILNENYFISSEPGTNVLSAITQDKLIHIIGLEENNGYVHRIINGGTWTANGAGPTLYSSGSLSCGSKDLYLYKIPDGYLKYQKYDDVPLTPSITGTVYHTGTNAHPYIYWAQYIEPDIAANTTDGFIIERVLDSGSPTQINIAGSNTSFIDWAVNYAGSGPCHSYYKVKAKDTGGKTSGWSNTADIPYGDAWKSGTDYNDYEFNLFQNYPNPFNPSTIISYSLPLASKVKITIFDLLGREIAEIVNGDYSAGTHSVEWNASGYPSGIYIYRITATSVNNKSFYSIKRMLLVK